MKISCLILTEKEATSVRDLTSSAGIDARMLADGVSWVLPARLLTDPAYEVKWPLLVGFPQREVDFSEFPPDSEPE